MRGCCKNRETYREEGRGDGDSEKARGEAAGTSQRDELRIRGDEWM